MFYLQTDALGTGVGAVLAQEVAGGNQTKPYKHPMAYFSAMLTPTEQNYNIYEKEFLVVKKVLEHWRAYLI